MIERCYTETRPNCPLPDNLKKRVWGIAAKLRDNRMKWLNDSDLLSLVLEALHYCIQKFDPAHPPKEGLRRRSDQDRLYYFFSKKLKWTMIDLMRKRREETAFMRPKGKERLEERFSMYCGPRGETIETAQQPDDKTPLLATVNASIGRLEKFEARLVELHYWREMSLRQLAPTLGMADHSTVRRELDRVHEKLRDIILDELDNNVLSYLDNVGNQGSKKKKKKKSGFLAPLGGTQRTFLTDKTVLAQDDGPQKVA